MEVVWGKKAENSYFKELEIINNYHSQKEVENFKKLVDQIIYNLKTSVLEGKVSQKTKFNSFVISKQTTLYFDVNKEKSRLELLLFWQNKDDPSKLIEFLKEFE
ncbi:hypothetical protein [Polaribacter vadi]|uniref:hypothetical protein n=1 Tax=Polaribacter vadi TaxID=1774273 RepID=UPI0030EDFF47